jgi:hypothetical protein
MDNRDAAYKYIPKDNKRRDELEVEEEVQQQRPKHIISVSDWIIIFLIQCIPVVNIIALFVWAFSKSTPASKSNWAKASLIISAVFFVLYFVFVVIAATAASMY